MASQDTARKTNDFVFLKFSAMAIKPPIKTNSVTQFPPKIIKSDALNTRIIIHPRFPALVQNFLHHKLAHGSQFEKALYQSLSWRDQVRRLIAKRPLVFMGSSDYTILRNGRTISHSAQQWDRNGTSEQGWNPDLTLEEYLSYDEIMLSSLIGVAGPSYFINDGARNNCGRRGKQGTFELRGIIVGLVGARFQREDRMDSIFMLPPVSDCCCSALSRDVSGCVYACALSSPARLSVSRNCSMVVLVGCTSGGLHVMFGALFGIPTMPWRKASPEIGASR